MKPNDFYACFGGFGIQHWGNIYAPDIAGNCHALTVCVVDGETGAMQPVQQGPEVLSPSTLVVSPDQKYIYAGSEEKDFMGQSYGGGLNAFAFDMETGSLRLINQSLAYGSSTAYTTLDKTGQYIFVANHGSKFSVSRYEMENGALQPKVLRDRAVSASLRCGRTAASARWWTGWCWRAPARIPSSTPAHTPTRSCWTSRTLPSSPTRAATTSMSAGLTARPKN